MEHIELHQENVSAQHLEINGKFSCSSKTKHIKAKVFFIKKGRDDIVIKDCPTGVMWADINTKPKQGMVFKEMRAILMNCPVDYIDETDPRSALKQGALSKGTKTVARGVSSKNSGVSARGVFPKKKEATRKKPAAPKRNAKGGFDGNARPVAPVNQRRRQRPVQPPQECVGRELRELRDSTEGLQDFWRSLPFHTQHRHKGATRRRWEAGAPQ